MPRSARRAARSGRIASHLAIVIACAAGCGKSQAPEIKRFDVTPISNTGVELPAEAVGIRSGATGTIARSPVIIRGEITDNTAVGRPELRIAAFQCVCGQLEQCSELVDLPRRARSVRVLIDPNQDRFRQVIQLIAGRADFLRDDAACGDLDDTRRLRVRYEFTVTAEDPADQGEPRGRRAISRFDLVFDPPRGAADTEAPVIDFLSPERGGIDQSLTTRPITVSSTSFLLRALIRDNAGEPGRVNLGLCVPGLPARFEQCDEAVRDRCASLGEGPGGAFPRGCSCQARPTDLCPSGFALEQPLRIDTDRITFDSDAVLNFRMFNFDELLNDPAAGDAGGYQACTTNPDLRCNRLFIEVEDINGNPLDANDPEVYDSTDQPDPTRIVMEVAPEPLPVDVDDNRPPAILVTRTDPPAGSNAQAVVTNGELRFEGSSGDENGFVRLELLEVRQGTLCEVDCFSEVADIPEGLDPTCTPASTNPVRVFNMSPEGLFRCAFNNLVPPSLRVLRGFDAVGNRAGVTLEVTTQFDENLQPYVAATPSLLDNAAPIHVTLAPLTSLGVRPNDPNFEIEVRVADAVSVFRAEVSVNDVVFVPIPGTAFVPESPNPNSILVPLSRLRIKPANFACPADCDAACQVKNLCLAPIVNDGDRIIVRTYDLIEHSMESIYTFRGPDAGEFLVGVEDNVPKCPQICDAACQTEKQCRVRP